MFTMIGLKGAISKSLAYLPVSVGPGLDSMPAISKRSPMKQTLPTVFIDPLKFTVHCTVTTSTPMRNLKVPILPR